MKYLKILFIPLFFCSISFISAQTDNFRHQFQLGRSGIYFGDQPFMFAGFDANIGFEAGKATYIDIPYISYKYSFNDKVRIVISYEKWYTNYYKKHSLPEPLKIEMRALRLYQLSADWILVRLNQLRVATTIKGTYRKGSELAVHSYIDQGGGSEALMINNNINGFGAGVGIEADYRFYKRFFLIVKGEYLRFSDKRGKIDINYQPYGDYPKNHFGITFAIGCAFGKM